MSQNNTLSTKAKEIVDNFIKNNNYRRGGKISQTDTMKHVIVTLYSQKPDAKAELLEPFKDCIFNLHDYFTQEDINVLVAECGLVIKYCYEKSGRMNNISINGYDDDGFIEEILSNDPPLNIYKTPKSYLDLCTRLSGRRKAKEHIYLPYGEVPDFALYNPDAEYYIECKNESYDDDSQYNYTNAYFKILLDSLGIKAEIVYGDSDVFQNLEYLKSQPDYIFVCNPTLNQKCNNRLDFSAGLWSNPQEVKGMKLGGNLVIWARGLKQDGAIDCILPKSYLQDKDFWYIFNKLFDKKSDYSATVILLNNRFDCNVEDPFLMHIERSEENAGMIRMIDATGDCFYYKDFAKIMESDNLNHNTYLYGELNVEALMEAINQKECNPLYEERIHYSLLAGGKDNIVSHQHLIDKKLPALENGERYIPLRELVDIVPCNKIEEEEEEKEMSILRSEDLGNKYTDCDIDSHEITKRRISDLRQRMFEYATTYYALNENCILTGFKEDKLTFGKLNNNGQTIALQEGITSFRVKKRCISEDYLLRELTKEYCNAQAEMLTEKPENILETKFFLEIKIAVPSLEEQERRCKEDARKSLEEALKNLREADRQLLQSAEEFKRDVRMKKHAIGQTLFNLGNWWDLLQKIRKEGNGIVDDTKELGRIHKTQVSEIYSNIQMTIEKLQMQVDNFWRTDGMQTETISLNTFIKTYIKEHQSPIFTYEYAPTSILGNKNMQDIIFSTQALTMVFDDIINNACSHGFNNEASADNIVKIELNDGEKGRPNIKISNNGNPVHKDISPEDVFTYGRSSRSGHSHYGIGGYEIRNIMREFKGDVEFISAPQEEFPVGYKLTFKGINNIVGH